MALQTQPLISSSTRCDNPTRYSRFLTTDSRIVRIVADDDVSMLSSVVLFPSLSSISRRTLPDRVSYVPDTGEGVMFPRPPSPTSPLERRVTTSPPLVCPVAVGGRMALAGVRGPGRAASTGAGGGALRQPLASILESLV